MLFSTLLYSNTDEGWLGRAGFFLFSKPVLSVKFFKNRLLVNDRVVRTNNPLPIVEKFIKRGFYITGYVSYDFKEHTIKTKYRQKESLKLPLIYLNFYRRFTAFEPKVSNIKNIIKSLTYKTDRESFIKKVEAAKGFIESGDIYQINLSHRIDIDGIFFPLHTFLRLVSVQPTPYMMYLVDRDFRVLSGSMELFLKREKDKLVSIPIKGTCRKDEDYQKTLLNNPKERAENLMITDLMRNDLGRICRDVQVDRLFEVREYDTLYQMSSTVCGRLERDVSLKELLLATFPPGSVTGAPKKRAVELIDTLEDTKRDIYCGATLLINPNLDFTMSVAIRQLIFKRDRCHLYVGAGVVADSDPAKEYEETVLKAEANLLALTL